MDHAGDVANKLICAWNRANDICHGSVTESENRLPFTLERFGIVTDDGGRFIVEVRKIESFLYPSSLLHAKKDVRCR